MARTPTARGQQIERVAHRAAVCVRTMRRYLSGEGLHANTLRRVGESLAPEGAEWMADERSRAVIERDAKRAA